ncbi:hypothetical protein L1286_04355 [Pseudoalteromonas sp. SMS1]|uniref:hypothetical protein n=1 Tax=Pseudoalteromonas sp. SMS1 TaxID=2908894 RepID=UPI001F15E019|nr:hypothetical protein [Pseudoalteromonas sp. SMS1]MCF2856688.1 hypothetical protein [Pseudoalteromonas sp. SMS1]
MKMKLNKKHVKVLGLNTVSVKQTKQIGGGRLTGQCTYMECYSKGPIVCTSMPCT